MLMISKRNNMNWTTKIGSLALLFTLSFYSASAQRTMSGQSSLGVSARYNGTSVGAEAFYAQYTLGGWWETGVEGQLYNCVLSTGQILPYIDAYAKGGYQFRLAASRSRNIGLYAGGGAFVGIECMDPNNNLPSYISIGIPRWQFLYGVYGKLVTEFFVGKKVALTLDAELPVNFSSKLANLHWSVGAGIKVLL